MTIDDKRNRIDSLLNELDVYATSASSDEIDELSRIVGKLPIGVSLWCYLGGICFKIHDGKIYQHTSHHGLEVVSFNEFLNIIDLEAFYDVFIVALQIKIKGYRDLQKK